MDQKPHAPLRLASNARRHNRFGLAAACAVISCVAVTAGALGPARAWDAGLHIGDGPIVNVQGAQPEAGDRATPPNPGADPHAKPPSPPNAAQEPNSPKKPYEQAFADGFPKTPKQKVKVLSNLYAYLATAESAAAASEIANVIERLWLISGSDTIAVLMERSLQAVNAKNTDLALKLLDAVVDLAPDYAEGWNRRAFVHYLLEDRTRAAGDLRRVLALEPNHFKALQGLAQILKDADQKKGSLKAYRRLRDIHPFAEGAEEAVRELQVEIEGQGI